MTRFVSLKTGVLNRPVCNLRAPVLAIQRKKYVVARAKEDPVEADVDSEDAEERIARLEAAARGGRLPRGESEPPEDPAPPKRAWKEGKLLPEGWEDLTLGEKAWEIYAGERGALFWANKVAFVAAITVGVAWIFFRFVGPQLGLYELKSTFTS